MVKLTVSLNISFRVPSVARCVASNRRPPSRVAIPLTFSLHDYARFSVLVCAAASMKQHSCCP